MDKTTRAIIGSALSRNAKYLLLGLVFLSNEQDGSYSLPVDYVVRLLEITEYQNLEFMLVALGKLIKKGHISWVAEGSVFQLGGKVSEHISHAR